MWCLNAKDARLRADPDGNVLTVLDFVAGHRTSARVSRVR
jgi:hypothetical protein